MTGALVAWVPGGWFRSPPPAKRWRVDRAGTGAQVFGDLRTSDATRVVSAIRAATSGAGAVEIDFSGVNRIDGGVVALLRADLSSRGVRADILGGERFQSLFDLYAKCWPSQPPERRPERIAARVGRATFDEIGEIQRGVAFIGEMMFAIARVVRRPSSGRWKELFPLVERAGADALPIVVVINFLIGFVTAYMSASALMMFGANIYVADLVAVATTRQLAPLMTAIVVCGRSGAAFATELGSMKVSEEIDALRTLGLEPFGWLVLPRTLSLVLVVPVLTLIADIVGILGGLLVAVTSLGLSPRGYLNETRATLTAWDVESGILMSAAFALVIGLIACEQGFSATGGAQGVGRRTTKTVVASLFAIVLLDAAFTVFYRAFGMP